MKLQSLEILGFTGQVVGFVLALLGLWVGVVITIFAAVPLFIGQSIRHNRDGVPDGFIIKMIPSVKLIRNQKTSTVPSASASPRSGGRDENYVVFCLYSVNHVSTATDCFRRDNLARG